MINQEEYEVLKELGDKWKWIARDGFKGELNVYNVRPTRSYFKNWWLTNKWFGRSKTIPPYFFPFIQWTDSEPYFIPDLIKEYEKKKYRFRLGNLEISDFVDNSSGKSYTVFSLVVEEDEEMKKDKEWLKEEEVEKEPLYYVRILEEDEGSYIVKDLNTGKFEMGSKEIHPDVVAEYQTAFTKDEIELMDNGQVLFHTYAEEVDNDN